jgi:exodeoxyribonuclease-3
MKLLSWNVNGLRAVLKKNFLEFLEAVRPDILGLQEIKISEAAIQKEQIKIPGYEIFWNPAQRPGYSGTAILLRSAAGSKAQSYTCGWGESQFDNEGRYQVLELADFYYVNCYFPNANHELSRLAYKQAFNQEFLRQVKKLAKKKPVIACGDFNVAHTEIDLARPKENIGNAGFTNEERADMDKFLQVGLVDVYRHYFPKKIQYSWWSFRAQARIKNIGWRIDYFLASRKFVSHISDAYILDQVSGSDHAPVGIQIR